MRPSSASFSAGRRQKRSEADADAARKKTETAEKQIKGLAKQDPKFVTQVLKDLKLDKVSEEDFPKLTEAIGDLAQIFIGVDEAQRAAIKKLVEQLPEQGKKAIEQLSELMEELTAGQIAAVAGEVNRRVGLLNMFKERVLDDRTYEITGDGSIHRLLEQAMWIVDERYWLMHSNRQLRTIVTQAAREGGQEVQEETPGLRLRDRRQEADHHRDQAAFPHPRRRGPQPA